MIDGDCYGNETASYDEIGSVAVYMGKLMGAPKQVWEEKLFHKGEERGKIIVRTQTVSGALVNVDASFGLEFSELNNLTTNCFCCEAAYLYVFSIQKQIPGTNDFSLL